MAVSGISSGGAKLIGWTAVLVLFATVAVGLRFTSRRLLKQIGLDDFLMLFALLLYYGLYISSVFFATAGKLGFPQDELSPAQLEEAFKIFFAAQLLYGILGPTIKISILLLYRRLFTVNPWFLHLTTIVAGLVIIWCISVEFTVIFQCIPVGTAWKLGSRRSCINSQIFFEANGVSNFLLDAIILCMPIPMIWQLHLSIKRKISLSSVFALGLFACAAGILRIASLWRQNTTDFTDTLTFPLIWTIVEPGAGIICGCLPTLPILFQKFVHIVSAKRGSSRDSKLNQPHHPSLPRIRGHLRNDAQITDFSINYMPAADLEASAVADKAPLKADSLSSDGINVRTELTVCHTEAERA